MGRRNVLITTVLLLACIACSAWAADNVLTAVEKKAGWTLLFDGKTLNGWKATGNPEGWVVKDGAIENLAKGGGYLATTRTFGDFILSLDFKNDKGTNSGIFFRWSDLNDPVQTGIEMQILDSYGVEKPGKHDCGAIYDCLAPRKNVCKAPGEWNHVVLTSRNNKIFIDMNGVRILNMDLNRWTTPHKNPDGTDNKFNTAYKDMPRVGYIGFQDHGHKVWFKNIKIKEL